MKKLCEKISSNGRQILEIVALIIVTSIPWVVDLQEIFKEYLADHPISPDDFFWQVAFRMGKPVASVVLFFAVLIGIRKFNQGFVMNRKRVYHDYCYAWYWFCAKILGIKSCDLVLVPIHMQFKLVIRATFQEYPLDETDYPVVEKESDSKVSETNQEESTRKSTLFWKTHMPLKFGRFRNRNKDIGQSRSAETVAQTILVISAKSISRQ